MVEKAYEWTLTEVEDHLRLILPGGWSLQRSFDRGFYHVSLVDADEKSHWGQSGTDQRLLLLGAYGWLQYKQQDPKNSMWSRASELTSSQVAEDASKIDRFWKD